jgi:hypothetical protein
MANFKLLHLDLDTGKIVARNSGGNSASNSNFVTKSGDTMTGLLTLSGDPVDPLHASSKQYVDNLVTDVLNEIDDLRDLHNLDLGQFVAKSGDTMTGYLNLHADPINPLHAVPKRYVDDNAIFKSGGSMTGYLQLSGLPLIGSHAASKQYVDNAIANSGLGDSSYLPLAGGIMNGQITLPADPVDPLHAASKQYVDSVASGLDVKQSVRVLVDVDIPLGGLQVIDGVQLEEGDRVLVTAQTAGFQNGIYQASVGVWERSIDADGTPTSEVTSGLFTFIEEGGLYGNTGWVLTTPDPINLNVTDLEFNKFSATGEYILKAGDTMSGPLILNGNPTSDLAAANKGYIDNLIRNIGDKYIQAIASTTWTIAHNRNTTFILVQVLDGNEIVIPDSIRFVDADTIEINFGAPASGSANMVFFG